MAAGAASKSPPRSAVFTWLVAAISAAGGWCALLGWDTTKTLGSDGYLHEPYGAWQIVALVGVLFMLATWLGQRRSFVIGPAVAALVLSISFGVSAQLDPRDDGLWPIGAVTLLVGSFAGMVLVSRQTAGRAPATSAPNREVPPA